jgi:hypothetical protein
MPSESSPVKKRRTEPAAAVTGIPASSSPAACVVATAAELHNGASAADAAVAQAYFGRVWKLKKKRSGSLDALLGAQGCSLVIRKITDRLLPTITVDVSEKCFATNIKTPVSAQDLETDIAGGASPWFSSGRGDLVTRACLQDGGATLYLVTPVPPEQSTALEHKWFKVEVRSDEAMAADAVADGDDDEDLSGETADQTALRRLQFTETYRYDPSGAEDAASLRVKRVFLVKRDYCTVDE